MMVSKGGAIFKIIGIGDHWAFLHYRNNIAMLFGVLLYIMSIDLCSYIHTCANVCGMQNKIYFEIVYFIIDFLISKLY